MRYSFEKVQGEQLYQVRLRGQFVTYVTEKDPKLVDDWLQENGWESREAYFKDSVQRSIEALKNRN